jgi:hypothetical protein
MLDLLEKKLTMKSLKKALIVEKAKWKSFMNKKSEKRALVEQENRESKSDSDQKRRILENYYNYDIQNHRAVDCRKLKKNEKSRIDHAIDLMTREDSMMNRAIQRKTIMMWILNFEASSYMIMKRNIFRNYETLKKSTVVTIDDEETLMTERVRLIFMKLNKKHESQTIELRNALYVSRLRHNLLSIYRVMREECSIIF